MDGEKAKPRGRKTGTPKAPRHEARYGPMSAESPANDDGQEGRAWHEGAVGTLAFYDAEGNHLRTIYLGRMPEVKMATLADELELELHNVLEQRPDLDIVMSSDGDHHQWEILEQIALRLPATFTGNVFFLLDFYHAAERLGNAAGIVYPTDPSKRTVTASGWAEELKHVEDGAGVVLKKLRYHRDQLQTEDDNKSMQDIINYFAANRSAGRMDYAQNVGAHRPIGTGVTEAACKTVVNTRLKRSGMRFDHHGGQTILSLRTAHLSERFKTLMKIMTRTYSAEVETKIAA
jgi:hypothetical protein